MNKDLGQVFTPNHIVEKILNIVKYKNNCIDKTILEPSCGDGAFLVPILETLIIECKNKGLTDEQIKQQIEKNIYAVEVDDVYFSKTIENLEKITDKYSLGHIQFNIINEDTLLHKFPEKFDYIVGNPPYVKVKKDKYKNIKLLTGNTDLYIAFFSYCIDLLKEDGKLCFITPNSYLRNSSQKKFRQYLKNEKLIRYIYDYRAEKVFDNADTYTAITYLSKNDSDIIKYETSDYAIDADYNTLNDTWNFSKNSGTNLLKNVCLFQHGFATNADKIFISKVDDYTNVEVTFNGYKIEKGLLRKIVKGNKYKGKFEDIYVIFPYEKKNGKYVPIDENKLKTEYPLTYKYLEDNKEKLEARDLEKNALWYTFARSQSIQNIDKEKIVVNSVLEGNITKLSFYKIDGGIGVYSGIYGCDYIDYTQVKTILESSEICKYALECGKDMSGGYKSISAKILNDYKY